MDNESILALLAIGPAGAAAVYWLLYRYYRNTDKSHHFERETDIKAQPISGAQGDHKVGEVRGTREAVIQGNNAGDYRRRVQRM